MTDLETIIMEASKDFGRMGGVMILRGEATTNIGVYGLSRDGLVDALEEVLAYVRERMYGSPAGHTILRRE